MDRTDQTGRILRTVSELRHVAHQLVDEICDDIEWKRRMGYERGRTATPGPISGGRTSDPTLSTLVARDTLRTKVRQGIRDLVWLVDKKLPEIARRLELEDDRPTPEDERGRRGNDGSNLGPARLDGGLSAYRGDRHAPSGRPDLHEALDAQRRRRQRGQEYGDA